MKVVLKQRILSVTLAQRCHSHASFKCQNHHFYRKNPQINQLKDLHFFKKYLEIKMLL